MLNQSDIVYISGPMSGLPDQNRQAFRDAEKFLTLKYGCTVLNPARHPDGLSYCEYMRRALNDLEAATHVVALPGSDASIGAAFEISAAFHHLKLPVSELQRIQQ